MNTKAFINKIANKCGYQINKVESDLLFPQKGVRDVADFKEVYEKCKPHTLTGLETMYDTYIAAKYVVLNDVPGDIVECGTWKGGNMMVAAEALKETGGGRAIYLYDTFEGLPQPNEWEKVLSGLRAIDKWKNWQKEHGEPLMRAPLEEAKENLKSTGYPNVVFVKGMVENTIPKSAPEKISVLRLDLDIYEGTKHALTHLYPKLSKGGVLIIDDYGCWDGAKKAVDDYVKQNKIKILLHRITKCARTGIKQ